MPGSACSLFSPNPRRVKLSSIVWNQPHPLVKKSSFRQPPNYLWFGSARWCLADTKRKCSPIPEARGHFTCFETWGAILLSTPYLWGIKFCFWSPVPCLRPRCQRCILLPQMFCRPACLSGPHHAICSGISHHYALTVSPDALICPWSTDTKCSSALFLIPSDNTEFYLSPVILENSKNLKILLPFVFWEKNPKLTNQPAKHFSRYNLDKTHGYPCLPGTRRDPPKCPFFATQMTSWAIKITIC